MERYCLAGLWGLIGGLKVVDPAPLREYLASLAFVGDAWAPISVWVVILAELLLAAYLAICAWMPGMRARCGLPVLLSLLLALGLLIASATAGAGGQERRCGCLGSARAEASHGRRIAVCGALVYLSATALALGRREGERCVS